MNSTHTNLAPEHEAPSAIHTPDIPAFASPILFGPSPSGRRTRLRGRFALLLCDKCGESRVERRSRHGVLSLFLSLVGFFPHKCRKCNAKQYRLISSFRLTMAILLALVGIAVSVYSSGIIRRLKPEPRPISSTAAASEDAYFAAQLASGRLTAFEKLLSARKKQVLHNEDVILLLHSGIERDIVLKLIKTSSPAYDITPGGILELRHAGADNTVILAVIERLTSNDSPTSR